MSDFETPMMRDISKMMFYIMIGLLSAIGTIVFVFFPFSLTVYGNHCWEGGGFSILEYIVRSLTISC